MADLRTLAVVLLPLALCWQLLSRPEAPTTTSALAAAAVVLAGIALAFLGRTAGIAAITAGPLTGLTRALREKSRGAVYQRQLNPDAAGHARPRAPGAVPAAA